MVRNPSQPYYSRPTPPDLQLKTNRSLIQPSYDGNTVYQWNIDGKSKYEIANTLKEMGICETSYIAKGVSVKDATKLLVSGFIGQLKNWWKNILAE